MKSKWEVTSESVAQVFKTFKGTHSCFKKENGLTKKIKNVHEILTGMTDKHGRICRYIKHQERKDPKKDWPKGMTSAMTGYLVYMMMLLDYYNIDISEGMIEELNEALKQHKK